MAGTFTNLLYHIVYSTKHRQSLIQSPLRDELYKYIGGIIRAEKGILLEIGGTTDHVHLVTRFKADSSVAEMLRLIKCNGKYPLTVGTPLHSLNGVRRLDLRNKRNRKKPPVRRPIHSFIPGRIVRQPFAKRRRPMTICAAAICKATVPSGKVENVLLAISDRMVTSGDIEYETSQSKIYGFSLRPDEPTKIVALGAGDASSHDIVVKETHEQMIHDRITKVGEAAQLYAENFAKLRRYQAERTHLSFLNLDIDSFISRQQEMDPSQVAEISDRLRNQQLGVSTIIAGVDSTAHIYTIGGYDEVTLEEYCHEICHDSTGFCAVGWGARQFETQYMFSRYDSFWPLASSIFLMYLAKKRSEVAPGVGPSTDMFYIDSSRSFSFLRTTIDLLEQYRIDFERVAFENWTRIVRKVETESGLIQTPQRQQGQTEQAPPTTDQTGVPGGPSQSEPEAPPEETGQIEPTPPSEPPSESGP